MAATLPFRARTATGTVLDIVFPLHADTGDARCLGALVSALLDTVDAAVTGSDAPSNGDVLQALAMTLALRAAMIEAPAGLSATLARDLFEQALEAAQAARAAAPAAGRA